MPTRFTISQIVAFRPLHNEICVSGKSIDLTAILCFYESNEWSEMTGGSEMGFRQHLDVWCSIGWLFHSKPFGDGYLSFATDNPCPIKTVTTLKSDYFFRFDRIHIFSRKPLQTNRFFCRKEILGSKFHILVLFDISLVNIFWNLMHLSTMLSQF